MKVGGDALFDNAKFLGPVNFRYANIANNFSANNATFQDAKHGAVFSGMKVGGDATFYAAVFNGPVHFSYADFARLSLSCPFSPEVAAQFHMQGMSYKYIRAVSLPELPLGLEYIPKFPQFEISPVLRKIPLYPLPAYIPKFPRFKFEPMQDPRLMILYPGYRGVPAYLVRPVTFQSPSYVPAILESESESPEELLKLADWSAYSADVYSNLEGFFLRRGDRDDADKAFFAGKHRQREEYFGSGHWFRWLGSWTLDLLVGYGRHPWQAGIPCVVLIALGCVLFSPKKMEPQNPNETPRVYSRFWYSLGLFLPFVDLQVGKVWKPKADETFLRNYMRVHILLGWILIPLVLAAVTGLIK
jgi:hypothetical protein